MIIKIINYQKREHSMKLDMYVGVWDAVISTFLICKMQMHFLVESFEMLLHLHSAWNLENNRWREGNNGIMDGILD